MSGSAIDMIVIAGVAGLVIGFALGVMCRSLMENRPPAHQHDWTRWEESAATFTRFPIFNAGRPMVGDCTIQQRSCTTCGYTETQDI